MLENKKIKKASTTEKKNNEEGFKYIINKKSVKQQQDHAGDKDNIASIKVVKLPKESNEFFHSLITKEHEVNAMN